jgi:hypothetical protein
MALRPAAIVAAAVAAATVAALLRARFGGGGLLRFAAAAAADDDDAAVFLAVPPLVLPRAFCAAATALPLVWFFRFARALGTNDPLPAFSSFVNVFCACERI